MYFLKCLGNDLNISYSWRWAICHVSWVVEYFSWKYYRSKSCPNWSDSHGISKTYTFSDLYCFFFRFFSWFWIMNFSLNVQWVNNTNTYSDMKIVLPQNIFELIVWGTSFPVQREKDMVDFRRNGARFSKKMLDSLISVWLWNFKDGGS